MKINPVQLNTYRKNISFKNNENTNNVAHSNLEGADIQFQKKIDLNASEHFNINSIKKVFQKISNGLKAFFDTKSEHAYFDIDDEFYKIFA